MRYEMIVVAVLLAALVGILLVGILIVVSRQLRRAGDVIVTALRVQAVRVEELNAGIEVVAGALVAMIHESRADLGRLTEQVQRALGGTQPDGNECPGSIVIVRKGETETFRLLEERLGKLGLARVVWDRRQAERHSTPAASRLVRRRHERRGSAPVTWEGLGYLVVEPRVRHLA